MSSWQEIWEKKPDDETATSTLSLLLSADGYDTLAAITPKAWTEHVHRIASRSSLRGSDSVFDVGCGAGAFLWPFREKGQRVGGLDYSLRQVGRARAAMPEVADFTVGEALSLGERPTYDAVVSRLIFPPPFVKSRSSAPQIGIRPNESCQCRLPVVKGGTLSVF